MEIPEEQYPRSSPLFPVARRKPQRSRREAVILVLSPAVGLALNIQPEAFCAAYGSSTVMCSRPARSMTFTAMGNSGEGVKGRVRWLVIRCHLSESRCG